jgi:hypothetical protein
MTQPHNLFHTLTDWRVIQWIPTPTTTQVTN